MRVLLISLIVAALVHLAPIPQPSSGVTVLSATQASAEFDGSQFHLVLTGDQLTIDRVCSFGDCAQGFPDRLSALNYWSHIYGLAYNIDIVPIPAPPSP